ncbi:aspartate kinase [Thermococcus sp.]
MVYKLSRRIVVKFGGSSLKNSFGEALELVQHLRENNSVVVVVSALKGVTDSLLELSRSHEPRILDEMERLHERAARRVGADISGYFRELEFILENPEMFPSRDAWKDHILSFGERLSAELFSRALEGKGIPSVPVDAFHVVEARGRFGCGEVDIERTAEKIHLIERLLENGMVPVVTGFLGNRGGFRITLGRGGSDYTASVMGLLLNARAVAVMSDVSGIYTADPKLVRDAFLIPFVSYHEASMASALGMKALHEKAVEPLQDRIPLILGKTSSWKLGTLISRTGSGWPIIVHRELEERAEISVINTTEIPGIGGYRVSRRGSHYVCFSVDKSELSHALNEIHEVIFG